MYLHTRATASYLTLGGVLLLAISGAAQDDKGRERYEAAGTIRALAPGAVQVATNDNQLMSVKLPAKPADISFIAKAETSFLRPGMTVKFSTNFNKRGQPAEPISSLTVFTPLEATDLGVYPENAGAGGPKPLDGLFSEPEPVAQPKKKAPKVKIEDIPYRVGGRIVSLKGSKMIVAAGGSQLKCELADAARIQVALADLSYAKQGDKVEVMGWHYPATQPSVAMAGTISVTALEPLVGETKPRAGSKTAEKNANDEAPAKGKGKASEDEEEEDAPPAKSKGKGKAKPSDE
jgi:hypothetical protein